MAEHTIGPTIARSRLGRQMATWREKAGKTRAQAARELACSVSKIEKMEQGDVGMKAPELEVLLALYRVELGERERLRDLQVRGAKRGWWTRYGAIPATYAQFLDLEGAAGQIRIFEPLMVHGLVQSEGYATALMAALDPTLSDQEIRQQWRIKAERQRRMVDRRRSDASIEIILDEASLRREVGGWSVRVQQLEHLLALPRAIHLRLIPWAAGAHQGMLGAFTLFDDLPGCEAGTVAYIEGHLGNSYVLKVNGIHRFLSAYARISDIAMNEVDSRQLIKRLRAETPVVAH